MNRNQFLKALALLPFAGLTMKLQDLYALSQSLPATEKMPVLFLGHGSPMNAIEENEFVRGFRTLSQSIARPRAILCISAHWETKGTYLTASPQPRTIHDFGGFPKALFDVQYPAPGSPALAKETQSLITSAPVGLDDQWGLDHGAWSVIKHLYPQADIPVVQLSLDYSQGPQYHYELAKALKPLRHKGVLIIGSGNMVHNLGLVHWQKLNETYGFDWALEANEFFKNAILDKDHKALYQYQKQGKSIQMAIPTPEHYLPLLYTLALQEPKETTQFFNDKPVAGALTMTSVKIG